MDYITFAIVIVLMAICVFYLIYFALIRPTKHADKLDFLKYAPIAHRGLHGLDQKTPENSLAAFAKAIEKGYNIETDLWLTKDGVPVCFHDGDLQRMCGVSGHIKNLTLEEVKQLRLGGTEQTIPTLEELLTLVAGRTALLIEFKGNGKMGIEKAAYAQLCRYKGKYAVQAFDPRSMAWFKKNAPKVMRGQLAMACMGDKSLKWVERLLLTFLLADCISRPHFVSYGCTRMNAYAVGAVRRMHGSVFFWTVRDQETFDAGRKKGDNLIFEGFIPDMTSVVVTGAGKPPKGALQ